MIASVHPFISLLASPFEKGGGKKTAIYGWALAKIHRPILLKSMLLTIFIFSPVCLYSATIQLYDQAVLERTYKPYSENIRYNYKHVIEEKLSNDEYRKLTGITLDFPLRGENKQFFDFYSYPAEKNVVIPIEAVKFLDDVCQAAAWLEYKKETGQPLFDYISLLKYRPDDFPDGKPTGPLQALGLPLDPTLNSYVDDVSQKCLKSALLWIMAHEVGHVLYQHQGYHAGNTAEQIRSNESQADTFANLVFRRIGTFPGGMAHFFSVASILWTPYSALMDEKEWAHYLKTTTHPVAPKRLKKIAENMAQSPLEFVSSEPNQQQALVLIESLIVNLLTLSERLEGPGMQKFLALRAMSLDIDAMAQGVYPPVDINSMLNDDE